MAMKSTTKIRIALPRRILGEQASEASLASFASLDEIATLLPFDPAAQFPGANISFNPARASRRSA